jgi:hypothetical protein
MSIFNRLPPPSCQELNSSCYSVFTVGISFLVSQPESNQIAEIDDAKLKPASVEPSSTMAGMED